jgi:hypothetical protein
MRVTVQENIDIVRRSLGRNVLQSESQPASLKIVDKRPLDIAVAVSAHNCDTRSNRTQFVKNRFRANIAKVPDFIGAPGHFLYPVRKPIVSVGKNKNAERVFRFFRHGSTTNLLLRS